MGSTLLSNNTIPPPNVVLREEGREDTNIVKPGKKPKHLLRSEPFRFFSDNIVTPYTKKHNTHFPLHSTQTNCMGNPVTKAAFLPPYRNPSSRAEFEDKLLWLSNKFGHTFPVYHYVHPDRVEKTILFSHGNAEDVPSLISSLSDLGEKLRVNFLAYEYSGYSFSQKSSTDSSLPPLGEKYCYANALAAYDYLTVTKGIAPDNIISMGRSLGSGPATELAVRKPVSALILQSPLLSAIRVVMSTSITLPMDIFANIDKIHRVTCPVLIIHGTADEVINVEHGKKLFELVKHNNKSSLWIQGANHNDIEIFYFDEYFNAIRSFLDTLNHSNNNQNTHQNNSKIEKTSSFLKN
jgi:hypothetical protein